MKKFGLEVEFIGSTTAAIRSLRAAGLEVVDGSHSHLGFSETAWTVKRDGSVGYQCNVSGGEMVSPPLDFTDPAQRAQVTTAVQALQDSGATTHHTAGIHVHIEAKHESGIPMTAKEIAAVVRFTYKFEDAIYRIASSGWATIRGGARTYAQPIPENTARAIMDVRTMEELEAVWDGEQDGRNRVSRHVTAMQDRYTATNLRSYFMRGTIEFRYFNSSVNPERVQAYIALCMAIVDDARNGFSRSVKKSYRVGSMLNGTVSEDALFLRLQQILRSNSRDTKVCMSTEDWKRLRKLCWGKGSKPQQDIFYRH